MPNVSPVGGIPGAVSTTSGYPQYGMLWANNAWSVVTANNATEKQNFVSQGAVLWFTSEGAAKSNIAAQSSIFNGQIPGSSWLTGLGGMIASGLESGFVAFITDLWSGIVGYVEIFAGAFLALCCIVFIFKNDLMALAPLALALAGLLGGSSYARTYGRRLHCVPAEQARGVR